MIHQCINVKAHIIFHFIFLFSAMIETSAITGQGLMESMDWLALQLGSNQPRKTSNPTVAITDRPIENKDSKQQPKAYCTRAYSAIKCLFNRTNTQDSDD